MAALSADKSDLEFAERGSRRTFVIANGTSMYRQSLVALDGGYAKPWADTSGFDVFLGLFLDFERALYNGAVVTAGSTSVSPSHRAVVQTNGPKLISVDVTGVSAITSLGALVYCATDNPADLTLSATTNVGAVGWLCDFRSASDMDVQLFTPEEYLAKL